MLTRANRTSWNIPLNSRPPLRTSAWAGQRGIHPWPNLLGHYGQSWLFHLPTWVPLTMFTLLGQPLILNLGLRPNININNELLGPIPLQYVYTFGHLRLWSTLNITMILVYFNFNISFNPPPPNTHTHKNSNIRHKNNNNNNDTMHEKINSHLFTLRFLCQSIYV